VVSITDPANGTTVASGTPVSFAATASDTEDGDLGAGLSWVSDLDGAIGSGASFSSTLSEGTHTITASVTDSGGLSGSAQVSVTVTAVTACSDGLDNDGDGLIDFPDDPGCESAFDTSEVDGVVVATFPLQAGNDDGEQKQDGSITLTSADLEMFDYDAGGPHMAVGLRFADLNIPPGATIQAASVQFTAATNASGPADFVIHAESSDSAPPFTTTAFDLTSRPATAAVVNWSPGPWAAGAAGTNEQTADLAPIVQEIVDRLGWSSGGAIAFIITGSGDRAADSFNAAPADAAVLTVEYLTATGGNTAPVVSITDPANGTTVASGTPVSFAATASDAEDGDLGAGLSWVSDLDGAIGSGASFSSTLSEGAHTITASVTDSGGLSGSAQVSVTVTAANTAPVVSITDPANGTTVASGTPVSFAATASDTEDGDLKWTARGYRDGHR
jgi:hypothetical protein